MRNGKPIGIILFVVVGLLIASMVQNQNVVALDTSFIKNTECLMNECITIFQIPNQLTEEEQALIDEVSTVFFQDGLPFEFQQKAEEQQKIIGERDLLAEQQATNQTSEHLNEPIKSEDESGITRVGGVSLGVGNPSETALMLVEKQTAPNVFTRGDIVKVVGKIILDKPSPYFMNINITCCEMSSFRAMSAVETDPQGNFVIKFATSMVYPLGDWKVVISTIGDDNKILNNVYDFKLIDEFGNER